MSVEEGTCTHCGTGPIYLKKGVATGTALSPGLLPGLGFFGGALDVVACENCGFVQLFVAKSYRKALAKSWERVAT